MEFKRPAERTVDIMKAIKLQGIHTPQKAISAAEISKEKEAI